MRTSLHKSPALSACTSAPDTTGNNVTLVGVAGTRVIRRRDFGLMSRAEHDARRDYYASYNRRLYLASHASPSRRRGV